MMSVRLVLALLVLLPRLVMADPPPKYTISREYTGGMNVVSEKISIVPDGTAAKITVTRGYDGGKTEKIEGRISAKEYTRICRVLEENRVMSLANVAQPANQGDDTPTDLLTYVFKVKRGDSAEKTLSVWGPEILGDQPAYGVICDTVGEAGQRAVDEHTKKIKTGQLRRRGRGGQGGPGEGLVGTRPDEPLLTLPGGSPRPSNT